MPTLLIIASVALTLALIFYSIGVWGERLKHRLTWGNIIFFGLGFISDSSGTYMMTYFVTYPISFKLKLHMIIGTIALILMFIHLVWAIFVRTYGNEHAKQNFHKFSIFVWAVWVISYVQGILIDVF